LAERGDIVRQASPGWAGSVLAFWFEELEPADWFRKSDATDETIRSRFMGLHGDLLDADATVLTADAETALAAILVLDQFPRNMFRGTPESFASDGLALDVARRVVDDGLDAEVALDRRVFIYLPFEHSENLADQHRAVNLITPLGNADYTRYAIAHRDVIERFGRFPHRNAILARASTPDERAYLAEPGSGF
jgi:uncharacterized protein (DUF924 family)